MRVQLRGRRAAALAVTVLVCAGLCACTADGGYNGAPAPTRTPTTSTDRPPAPPPDPWQGYFGRVQPGPDETSATRMWGSFGLLGAIQPVESHDLTMAARPHTVEFRCAGPARVTVSVSSLGEDAEPMNPATSAEVVCPAATTLSLTTTRPGLALRADSHAAPGAFLFVVDPGGAASP